MKVPKTILDSLLRLDPDIRRRVIDSWLNLGRVNRVFDPANVEEYLVITATNASFNGVFPLGTIARKWRFGIEFGPRSVLPSLQIEQQSHQLSIKSLKAF